MIAWIVQICFHAISANNIFNFPVVGCKKSLRSFRDIFSIEKMHLTNLDKGLKNSEFETGTGCYFAIKLIIFWPAREISSEAVQVVEIGSKWPLVF